MMPHRDTVMVIIALAAWLYLLPREQATAETNSNNDVRLVVQSHALNHFVRELDGQWQGIRVASDGNCYFASSTHSARNGAAFFRYDPRTKILTLLCEDITKVCGEDPTKTPPQGKIHSDIVEANGWLYFGTHLANYWPDAMTAYTGAHVVGYEMTTGRFRDHGIVRSNYSIYAGLNVDPVRKRIFVIASPFNPAHREGGCHLYTIDLQSGEKRDLGNLQAGPYSYYLFIDTRGDCWFTNGGSDGALYRARAKDGHIDRFPKALPDGADAWSWCQPLADGFRCVFTLFKADSLWIFDSRGENVSAASFQLVKRIGLTHQGNALGEDRVYYVQCANPAEMMTARRVTDLHLRSVSLGPGESSVIVDHGLIVDQDGRKPIRIHSLDVDDEGHVFMTGDWQLLPGEKGTLRHDRHRDGTNVYKELSRGQFFAVGSVTVPAKPAKP